MKYTMKRITILLLALIVFNNKVNAQWTAVNTGLPYLGTNEFECFAVIGTDLFVGTGSGVYVSSNNGTSWSAVNSGLTNTDIETLASIGSNLFAGTGNGIFKSVDNGTSWTSISTGLNTSNGTSVYSLFASGNNLFAGTEAGVFISGPPYTSWTSVNTGLQLVDFYSFTQIGTYIFSGGLGVYRTSNNGTNWTEMTSGLPSMFNSDFESFAVLGSNVFAGDLSLGVFKSTDNGSTWSAVNSGLTDLNTQALAANGTNLYAGGLNGGVFLSANNGTSWTPMNTGLTNLQVLSFQIYGTYLYVGTRGGVFRSPMGSAGINQIQNDNIAINISPNPCNKALQITCTESGMKYVEIYNILGERVLQKELNNQIIDISTLKKGMYIVKVTGNEWAIEKKIFKE